MGCARIPRVFRLASQNRKRPLSDSGTAIKLARMTATTSLRDTVFSLLAEYGGGALARIGKVWAAIRRAFGNVRLFLRPLLKELITFLMSKAKSGATMFRNSAQKAGSTLLHMAQRFMGKSPSSVEGSEPEPEPTKNAKRVAETAPKKAAPEPCASASSAPAESSNLAQEAILAPRESNAANVDLLSSLGPVVGRALIQAFHRPRMQRRNVSLESQIGFGPIIRAREAAAARAKQAQANAHATAATAQH
ncbi:MAG: hypothetical protein U0441_30285 [Polyangiaceae bacterium]